MYETYRETYEDYSTHGLMNRAETFRAHLAAANVDDNSYGQIRRRQARPGASRTVVSSDDGGTVRLDFSYQARAKEILNDMHDIDSVIDEGWRRIDKEQEYVAPFASLLIHLEREARQCLDLRLGRNLSSTGDFSRMSTAITRDFRP